ncbi:hypothetical protein BGZ57DRAFT_346980 [Hyaloscypha finlandica]|nr:hypothetical protein BGZ57DRAFT_346980 [Hyaloscypha finlandica]
MSSDSNQDDSNQDDSNQDDSNQDDSNQDDSNQDVPPNAVQSTDGLDALPNAPAPATVDPQHGLTIPNDAVPNLLTRSPDDPPIRPRGPPPGKKILLVKSNTKSKDKSEHEPSPSPPPKSPTTEAALQLPASSSNNQNKPPTPKAKSVKKDKPAAPKKPVVTKPSPVKVRLTISKPKQQNGPIIPVRGIDFHDTGFVPTGRKYKTGKRIGHLSNKDCSGSLPNGCSLKEWKDKFRSVESGLRPKVGKDGLDDMRDAGWVSDMTLHMLEKDRQRKEAKAAKKAVEARLAGEKNEAVEAVEEQDEEMEDVEEQDEEMEDVDEQDEEMEDVEELDEEMKDVEEEEKKEEEEEENQVYVPPQIEENMDDIYDA